MKIIQCVGNFLIDTLKPPEPDEQIELPELTRQSYPQLKPELEDDTFWRTGGDRYLHLKGKPHWRRIRQVYLCLDEAKEDNKKQNYKELISYVRKTTGKGCSKKLIAKWKRERGHL